MVRPLLLAVCTIMPLAGCVSLNVPSIRYDDPADRGGPLGPWHTGGAVLPGPSRGCTVADRPPAEEVANPAVPWPKFHPVPTRPVFGGNYQ